MNTTLDVRSEIPPHGDQIVLSVGPRLKEATSALILLHGRGASAQSMLSLYSELAQPGLAGIIPQAAGSTWYPHSFLAERDSNQPGIESALAKVNSIVLETLARGLPESKIALLGFSQGACVTAEFVARFPRKYGAVMVLTGGLIGPTTASFSFSGNLESVPIFLGSSDPDPHVPFERVLETKRVFRSMGATVELRRYPGLPHTINADERSVCRAYLQNMRTGVK